MCASLGFRDMAHPAQGRVVPWGADAQEVPSLGGRVCPLRLVQEFFSGPTGPWALADHEGGPARPLLPVPGAGDAAIATAETLRA